MPCWTAASTCPARPIRVRWCSPTRAAWTSRSWAARTSSETRLAGNVDYLSSYIYRLVFNDNFWQAVSSEVQSNISLTHAHNGFIPSLSLERFQTFAGTTAGSSTASINGNQARILHLPSLRFDVLDRPLGASPLYWGMGSSLGYLGRSEPGEQIVARRRYRDQLPRPQRRPHRLLSASGAAAFRRRLECAAEAAVRETAYTLSQTPDLKGVNGGVPTISHDALNRGF
jgi:LPS-assembly protein